MDINHNFSLFVKPEISLHYFYHVIERQKFQDSHNYLACPVSKNSNTYDLFSLHRPYKVVNIVLFLNNFQGQGIRVLGECLCFGSCGLVLAPPTHPSAVYAFMLTTGILRLALLLNRFSLSQQSKKIILILKYMSGLLGSNNTQPSELKTGIAKLFFNSIKNLNLTCFNLHILKK